MLTPERPPLGARLVSRGVRRVVLVVALAVTAAAAGVSASASTGVTGGTGTAYHLNDSWTPKGNWAFNYGRSSDTVLVGDWDGDGRDTLAVRRGNRYVIDNVLGGGRATTVVYGKASDTVLVGDWDGDGQDTLAVRRGKVYHVKNSISGGAADQVVVYGRPGDQVLVGDWDGDSQDTLAVRRGKVYHVKNSISGGAADTVIAYGMASDEVLVGDWDGDSEDTLTVRRSRTYYMKDSITGGPADQVLAYGRPDDVTLLGDWDGDGKDSLGVRRAETISPSAVSLPTTKAGSAAASSAPAPKPTPNPQPAPKPTPSPKPTASPKPAPTATPKPAPSSTPEPTTGVEQNGQDSVVVEPAEPLDPVGPDFPTEPVPAPTSGDWSHPGLVDRGGNPIVVATPAAATGSRVSVLDHGADPSVGTADDAVAIRRAIDAAEPGDEVYLPAGTYDLRTTDPDDDSAVLKLRSGVDLVGAGTATRLVFGVATTASVEVIAGAGVEDVIIRGLTITSDYAAPLSTNTQDGTTGVGSAAYGIYLGTRSGVGSSHVLIDQVRVEKFRRHGISLKSSHDVTVTRSHLANATSVGPGGRGYGIAVEGSSQGKRYDEPNDSRHNVIADNTFDGAHLRHAVVLQFATHNNLVADNRITGSLLDAIDVHGQDEYLNEIAGNTVTGGSKAGIALGNGGGSTHLHDASGPGNWIHHNTLTGNRDGILVELGTPDTFIELNTITGGTAAQRSGIILSNAPGTVVRVNTLTGNTGDGFWGIRLVYDDGTDGRGAGSPRDVLITDNTVTGNRGGIRIDDGDNVRLTRNTVTGNGEDVRIGPLADVVQH